MLTSRLYLLELKARRFSHYVWKMAIQTEIWSGWAWLELLLLPQETNTHKLHTAQKFSSIIHFHIMFFFIKHFLMCLFYKKTSKNIIHF